MGRLRKPSNVLELNGAFKQHPSRRRKAVRPPDRVVGDPPEHFDEYQVQAWTEIVRDAPSGVLKASDRQSVELLATLIAEFRQAPYAMNAAKHGATLKLLTHFAMTPSSRENFSIPDQDATSAELAEFRT
jgi:hypothetical protein